MHSLRINEEQIIWLCVLVSLLVHGLLFTFTEGIFSHHAQYSVQTSSQMVEVSFEDMKETPESRSVIPSKAKDSSSSRSVADQNDIKLKQAALSKSGVKVKANPNYFQNLSPEYPELAKQMRQEGIVLLSVDVDKAGEPVDVEIIQSSGYHLLDQAALKAIRHWKFQPGSIGNVPIDSTVIVPIRFRIEK